MENFPSYIQCTSDLTSVNGLLRGRGHVLNCSQDRDICSLSIEQLKAGSCNVFSSVLALSSRRAFTLSSDKTRSKFDKSTKLAEMAREGSMFSTLCGQPLGTKSSSPGERRHSLGWVRERRGCRLRSGAERVASNTASVECT